MKGRNALYSCKIARGRSLISLHFIFKKFIDKSALRWYNIHVIKGSGQPSQPQKGSSMTKIEMLNSIRTAVSDNADMVAFIDHEIELLQRKASTPRKPTKTQIENEDFKNAIVSYLTEEGEPRTIKSITESLEVLDGLSNQRVTHLLTALRNEGKVKRTVVKKVPFYEVGTEEKEEG